MAAFERQEEADGIRRQCPELVNCKNQMQTNMANRIQTLCVEMHKLLNQKRELLNRAIQVSQEVERAYQSPSVRNIFTLPLDSLTTEQLEFLLQS